MLRSNHNVTRKKSWKSFQGSCRISTTCNQSSSSGAKILEIINVHKYHTRLSRLPAAAVGDFCNVVVKKGPAELRKQVHGAVIIRQKYAIRRLNGVRVSFEDNAAVIITPEGELKGTDIKGPVAVEASEKWPRIANLASMVV